MKKYLTILITVAICSVAFAAVQLTITVPDQYTLQVLAAMNTLADTHMTLEARGSSPNPTDDFDGRWDFRIAPKDPAENNLQFAKRFTTELLRASVRLVKSSEENQRYREEVSQIAVPDVNVPNGIIE